MITRVQKAGSTVTVIVVCLLVSTLFSCTSRYHPTLLLTYGELNKRVKIEQAELLPHTRIADPFADGKLIAGDGSCLVIQTLTRGRQDSAETSYRLLSYDEILRCRLFIQTLEQPRVDTISLPGNSFVQILGRYDQPKETKIFPAKEGSMIVDSISKGSLWGTVDGVFVNPKGEQLSFTGQFKVRVNK